MWNQRRIDNKLITASDPFDRQPKPVLGQRLLESLNQSQQCIAAYAEQVTQLSFGYRSPGAEQRRT